MEKKKLEKNPMIFNRPKLHRWNEKSSEKISLGTNSAPVNLDIQYAYKRERERGRE